MDGTNEQTNFPHGDPAALTAGTEWYFYHLK
jgi:hypothetical protein